MERRLFIKEEVNRDDSHLFNRRGTPHHAKACKISPTRQLLLKYDSKVSRDVIRIIAETQLRNINETSHLIASQKIPNLREYVLNLRYELTLLRRSIKDFVVQQEHYPRTKPIFSLLRRYIAVEIEVFARSKTEETLKEVKQNIHELLEDFLLDYFYLLDENARSHMIKIYQLRLITDSFAEYLFEKSYHDKLTRDLVEEVKFSKIVKKVFVNAQVVCIDAFWLNDDLKDVTKVDNCDTDSEGESNGRNKEAIAWNNTRKRKGKESPANLKPTKCKEEKRKQNSTSTPVAYIEIKDDDSDEDSKDKIDKIEDLTGDEESPKSIESSSTTNSSDIQSEHFSNLSNLEVFKDSTVSQNLASLLPKITSSNSEQQIPNVQNIIGKSSTLSFQEKKNQDQENVNVSLCPPNVTLRFNYDDSSKETTAQVSSSSVCDDFINKYKETDSSKNSDISNDSDTVASTSTSPVHQVTSNLPISASPLDNNTQAISCGVAVNDNVITTSSVPDSSLENVAQRQFPKIITTNNKNEINTSRISTLIKESEAKPCNEDTVTSNSDSSIFEGEETYLQDKLTQPYIDCVNISEDPVLTEINKIIADSPRNLSSESNLLSPTISDMEIEALTQPEVQNAVSLESSSTDNVKPSKHKEDCVKNQNHEVEKDINLVPLVGSAEIGNKDCVTVGVLEPKTLGEDMNDNQLVKNTTIQNNPDVINDKILPSIRDSHKEDVVKSKVSSEEMDYQNDSVDLNITSTLINTELREAVISKEQTEEVDKSSELINIEDNIKRIASTSKTTKSLISETIPLPDFLQNLKDPSKNVDYSSENLKDISKDLEQDLKEDSSKTQQEDSSKILLENASVSLEEDSPKSLQEESRKCLQDSPKSSQKDFTSLQIGLSLTLQQDVSKNQLNDNKSLHENFSKSLEENSLKREEEKSLKSPVYFPKIEQECSILQAAEKGEQLFRKKTTGDEMMDTNLTIELTEKVHNLISPVTEVKADVNKCEDEIKQSTTSEIVKNELCVEKRGEISDLLVKNTDTFNEEIVEKMDDIPFESSGLSTKETENDSVKTEGQSSHLEASDLKRISISKSATILSKKETEGIWNLEKVEAQPLQREPTVIAELAIPAETQQPKSILIDIPETADVLSNEEREINDNSDRTAVLTALHSSDIPEATNKSIENRATSVTTVLQSSNLEADPIDIPKPAELIKALSSNFDTISTDIPKTTAFKETETGVGIAKAEVQSSELEASVIPAIVVPMQSSDEEIIAADILKVEELSSSKKIDDKDIQIVIEETHLITSEEQSETCSSLEENNEETIIEDITEKTKSSITDAIAKENTEEEISINQGKEDKLSCESQSDSNLPVHPEEDTNIVLHADISLEDCNTISNDFVNDDIAQTSSDNQLLENKSSEHPPSIIKKEESNTKNILKDVAQKENLVNIGIENQIQNDDFDKVEPLANVITIKKVTVIEEDLKVKVSSTKDKINIDESGDTDPTTRIIAEPAPVPFLNDTLGNDNNLRMLSAVACDIFQEISVKTRSRFKVGGNRMMNEKIQKGKRKQKITGKLSQKQKKRGKKLKKQSEETENKRMTRSCTRTCNKNVEPENLQSDSKSVNKKYFETTKPSDKKISEVTNSNDESCDSCEGNLVIAEEGVVDKEVAITIPDENPSELLPILDQVEELSKQQIELLKRNKTNQPIPAPIPDVATAVSKSTMSSDISHGIDIILGYNGPPLETREEICINDCAQSSEKPVRTKGQRKSFTKNDVKLDIEQTASKNSHPSPRASRFKSEEYKTENPAKSSSPRRNSAESTDNKKVNTDELPYSVKNLLKGKIEKTIKMDKQEPVFPQINDLVDNKQNQISSLINLKTSKSPKKRWREGYRSEEQQSEKEPKQNYSNVDVSKTTLLEINITSLPQPEPIKEPEAIASLQKPKIVKRKKSVHFDELTNKNEDKLIVFPDVENNEVAVTLATVPLVDERNNLEISSEAEKIDLKDKKSDCIPSSKVDKNVETKISTKIKTDNKSKNYKINEKGNMEAKNKKQLAMELISNEIKTPNTKLIPDIISPSKEPEIKQIESETLNKNITGNLKITEHQIEKEKKTNQNEGSSSYKLEKEEKRRMKDQQKVNKNIDDTSSSDKILTAPVKRLDKAVKDENIVKSPKSQSSHDNKKNKAKGERRSSRSSSRDSFITTDNIKDTSRSDVDKKHKISPRKPTKDLIETNDTTNTRSSLFEKEVKPNEEKKDKKSKDTIEKESRYKKTSETKNKSSKSRSSHTRDASSGDKAKRNEEVKLKLEDNRSSKKENLEIREYTKSKEEKGRLEDAGKYNKKNLESKEIKRLKLSEKSSSRSSSTDSSMSSERESKSKDKRPKGENKGSRSSSSNSRSSRERNEQKSPRSSRSSSRYYSTSNSRESTTDRKSSDNIQTDRSSKSKNNVNKDETHVVITRSRTKDVIRKSREKDYEASHASKRTEEKQENKIKGNNKDINDKSNKDKDKVDTEKLSDQNKKRPLDEITKNENEVLKKKKDDSISKLHNHQSKGNSDTSESLSNTVPCKDSKVKDKSQNIDTPKASKVKDNLSNVVSSKDLKDKVDTVSSKDLKGNDNLLNIDSSKDSKVKDKLPNIDSSIDSNVKDNLPKIVSSIDSKGKDNVPQTTLPKDPKGKNNVSHNISSKDSKGKDILHKDSKAKDKCGTGGEKSKNSCIDEKFKFQEKIKLEPNKNITKKDENKKMKQTINVESKNVNIELDAVRDKMEEKTVTVNTTKIISKKGTNEDVIAEELNTTSIDETKPGSNYKDQHTPITKNESNVLTDSSTIVPKYSIDSNEENSKVETDTNIVTLAPEEQPKLLCNKLVTISSSKVEISNMVLEEVKSKNIAKDTLLDAPIHPIPQTTKSSLDENSINLTSDNLEVDEKSESNELIPPKQAIKEDVISNEVNAKTQLIENKSSKSKKDNIEQNFNTTDNLQKDSNIIKTNNLIAVEVNPLEAKNNVQETLIATQKKKELKQKEPKEFIAGIKNKFLDIKKDRKMDPAPKPASQHTDITDLVTSKQEVPKDTNSCTKAKSQELNSTKEELKREAKEQTKLLKEDSLPSPSLLCTKPVLEEEIKTLDKESSLKPNNEVLDNKIETETKASEDLPKTEIPEDNNQQKCDLRTNLKETSSVCDSKIPDQTKLSEEETFTSDHATQNNDATVELSENKNKNLEKDDRKQQDETKPNAVATSSNAKDEKTESSLKNSETKEIKLPDWVVQVGKRNATFREKSDHHTKRARKDSEMKKEQFNYKEKSSNFEEIINELKLRNKIFVEKDNSNKDLGDNNDGKKNSAKTTSDVDKIKVSTDSVGDNNDVELLAEKNADSNIEKVGQNLIDIASPSDIIEEMVITDDNEIDITQDIKEPISTNICAPEIITSPVTEMKKSDSGCIGKFVILDVASEAPVKITKVPYDQSMKLQDEGMSDQRNKLEVNNTPKQAVPEKKLVDNLVDTSKPLTALEKVPKVIAEPLAQFSEEGAHSRSLFASEIPRPHLMTPIMPQAFETLIQTDVVDKKKEELEPKQPGIISERVGIENVIQTCSSGVHMVDGHLLTSMSYVTDMNVGSDSDPQQSSKSNCNSLDVDEITLLEKAKALGSIEVTTGVSELTSVGGPFLCVEGNRDESAVDGNVMYLFSEQLMENNLVPMGSVVSVENSLVATANDFFSEQDSQLNFDFMESNRPQDVCLSESETLYVCKSDTVSEKPTSNEFTNSESSTQLSDFSDNQGKDEVSHTLSIETMQELLSNTFSSSDNLTTNVSNITQHHQSETLNKKDLIETNVNDAVYHTTILSNIVQYDQNETLTNTDLGGTRDAGYLDVNNKIPTINISNIAHHLNETITKKDLVDNDSIYHKNLAINISDITQQHLNETLPKTDLLRSNITEAVYNVNTKNPKTNVQYDQNDTPTDKALVETDVSDALYQGVNNKHQNEKIKDPVGTDVSDAVYHAVDNILSLKTNNFPLTNCSLADMEAVTFSSDTWTQDDLMKMKTVDAMTESIAKKTKDDVSTTSSDVVLDIQIKPSAKKQKLDDASKDGSNKKKKQVVLVPAYRMSVTHAPQSKPADDLFVPRLPRTVVRAPTKTVDSTVKETETNNKSINKDSPTILNFINPMKSSKTLTKSIKEKSNTDNHQKASLTDDEEDLLPSCIRKRKMNTPPTETQLSDLFDKVRRSDVTRVPMPNSSEARDYDKDGKTKKQKSMNELLEDKPQIPLRTLLTDTRRKRPAQALIDVDELSNNFKREAQNAARNVVREAKPEPNHMLQKRTSIPEKDRVPEYATTSRHTRRTAESIAKISAGRMVESMMPIVGTKFGGPFLAKQSRSDVDGRSRHPRNDVEPSRRRECYQDSRSRNQQQIGGTRSDRPFYTPYLKPTGRNRYLTETPLSNIAISSAAKSNHDYLKRLDKIMPLPNVTFSPPRQQGHK